ncbi:MAG: glycerol-3-phosphate 1-O-acyltransferase PlsY [Bacillota bacterium]
MSVLVLALAYVLGSAPVGYLVGKLHGTDIREHGSGNIGTTNVLRLFGTGWAILVLLIDAGKGYLACALGNHLGVPGEIVALAGLAAIAGHNWSVFLRFRGGKGAATTAGVFLYLTPGALGVGLGVSAFFWLFTRYMSLGVLLGVAAGAAWANLVAHYPAPNAQATILALVWIVLRHRGNIVRLLRGGERKIGQREQFGGGEDSVT